MKLKSSIVAFFGIISIIVLPCFKNNIEMDYYEIVTKSFTSNNAEETELIIKGWAKINLTDLNASQMYKEFKTITKKLAIPCQPTQERYPELLQYQQFHKESSALMEVSLESHPRGTYLAIIINLDSNQDAEKYYSRVQEIFRHYPQADLGVTLIGTFEGLLTQAEQQQIITTALQCVDAKLVEGINTESLVSYSGYTENCPDYLMVANQKINIGIGLRYHILDNKTYLNIGAPLIFQEY